VEHFSGILDDRSGAAAEEFRTAETTGHGWDHGASAAGRHEHPVLEKFFLGLKGNGIKVLADK
jgi:hypothetical protein